jgi:3-oxoacyl-[acyl-carrier-protein] synthase II
MGDRRVAITGIGVVSPAGVGAQALWDVLTAGKSATGEISLFDATGFDCRVGGEIAEFSARKFVPKSYRKSVKVMARDIEIAVAAADLAFRDAGIETRGTTEGQGEPTVAPHRLGCNIGAGLICTDLDELALAVSTAVVDGSFDMRAWGREGLTNLQPLWLLKYLPNMLSCHVTIIHGAKGPSNCITSGDASGHLAIGESGRYITRGIVDAVIAGGSESKLNPMGLVRQSLLKRLTPSANDRPASACRPFDASADGTVIGEGGALLVLEELDHAMERGATIYAELVGFAGACDGEGIEITRPNVGGLDRAVSAALADAGVEAGQVDLVVAHGTGVAEEDALEARAWNDALAGADEVPAVSMTGTTGSLFAGAGALEVAIAALCLHHQEIPPSVNATQPIDTGRLRFSDRSRSAPLDVAATGSFSVGGQSGACILRRYEP